MYGDVSARVEHSLPVDRPCSRLSRHPPDPRTERVESVCPLVTADMNEDALLTSSVMSVVDREHR